MKNTTKTRKTTKTTKLTTLSPKILSTFIRNSMESKIFIKYLNLHQFFKQSFQSLVVKFYRIVFKFFIVLFKFGLKSSKFSYSDQASL